MTPIPYSLHRLYTQVMAKQSSLGVISRISPSNSHLSIQLKLPSGNVISESEINLGLFSYQISKIVVSAANLNKGYGRLMQIHAAYFAFNNGLHFKFPAFSYTKEGTAAFACYPCTSKHIIHEKAQNVLSFTCPPVDIPFEQPPVTMSLPKSFRSLDIF